MNRPVRRDVTIRRFGSNAEADRHDVEFRRSLSADDRVLLAWQQLSAEQWELV